MCPITKLTSAFYLVVILYSASYGPTVPNVSEFPCYPYLVVIILKLDQRQRMLQLVNPQVWGDIHNADLPVSVPGEEPSLAHSLDITYMS